MGQSGARPPTVEIVDELGQPVFTSSRYVAAAMLDWLNLETVAGDITPGLAELRDQLRQEFENDAY